MNILGLIFIVLLVILLIWLFTCPTVSPAFYIQETRPPVVTGIAVSGIKNDKVMVSWNPVAESNHYMVVVNDRKLGSVEEAMNLPERRRAHVYKDTQVELCLPKGTWYLNVISSFGENCFGPISDTIVVTNY